MRLTSICYKHSRLLLFEKLLKNRRSLKPHDWGIPHALISKGVPVYDGYRFAREKDAVDFQKYLKIEHRQLQPEFAYEASDSLRLTEGGAQLQLLTNSLFHNEMPSEYLEMFSNTQVSDHELAWMRKRFETVKFDSYQMRLAIAYEKERPWVRLMRPYGVDRERRCRQITQIFNDYVRLTSDYVNLKANVDELSCQYTRQAKNPYIFHGTACVGTLSSKALPLVGNPSASGSLPSMYPAAPEMDLKKTFDYEPKTVPPVVPISERQFHLHTIYVNHPYVSDWSRQERLGVALMQTFAFAAASADKTGDPRVLQTVYHDVDHVDFVLMQLNTLLKPGERESDVRNEIWHVSAPMTEGKDHCPSLAVLKWLKVFYAR